MTTGPDSSQPEPTQPYGAQQPDPGAVPPPPPPPPPTAQFGAPPPPPPMPGVPGAYGVSAAAPYGLHPPTGIPYSDKSKIVAGLLNILLPCGIGRFYMGDTRTGVLQLVVAFGTCGIGTVWSLIDGVLILVNDTTRDANGYILRS